MKGSDGTVQHDTPRERREEGAADSASPGGAPWSLRRRRRGRLRCSTCCTGPRSPAEPNPATAHQRLPGKPEGGDVRVPPAPGPPPRPCAPAPPHAPLFGPARPGGLPQALTALAHAAGAQHGQFDVPGQEVVGGGLGDGREQKVPGHAGRPHGARPAAGAQAAQRAAAAAGWLASGSAGTRVPGPGGPPRCPRHRRRLLKGSALRGAAPPQAPPLPRPPPGAAGGSGRPTPRAGALPAA